MDGIYTPASLSAADAVLSIASQLEKLNNPSSRKKIEDDIVAAHALNETEARKASEARLLIKQHSEILEETKKTSEKNINDKNLLENEKSAFKAEIENENLKLNVRKSDIDKLFSEAKKLHDEAVEFHKNISIREEELNREKNTHKENIRKLSEKEGDLEKSRQDIEAARNQVMTLDKEIKAKVDKLKQFNF